MRLGLLLQAEAQPLVAEVQQKSVLGLLLDDSSCNILKDISWSLLHGRLLLL